jgi:cobaltochelatase CobS
MKVTKKLKDVFNLDVPDTVPIEVEDQPPQTTPKPLKGYFFNKETIKRLLLWINGIAGPSIILTGPTGCGKSSVIEQFCARLGIGVYRVPCHGRMEFQELIGGFRLADEVKRAEDEGKPLAKIGKWEALIVALKNLSGIGPKMIWIDGPVIRAMREGCVVLLDEFNFLHPTVFGGLNSILDAASFVVPETGEIITAQAGFRVAMTGNGVDGGADAVLYRGISKVNIAGLDRPCGIRVGYNAATEEAQIIVAAHPTMNPTIVEVMVNVADDVRGLFKSGQCETVISTRKLVQWAALISARPWKDASPADILELMKKTLDFALLDVRPPHEQEAVHKALESRFRVSGVKAAAKP